MEDPTTYPSPPPEPAAVPVKPLDDPDFIGAEAALKRAAAKAIGRARAAGLEPVIAHPEDSTTTNS